MKESQNNSIVCPLCGTTKLKFKWRWFDGDALAWTSDVKILQCLNCGLVFSVLSGTVNDKYNKEYYVFKEHRETADRSFAAHCCTWLNKKNVLTGKRLLDVGCGRGYFCEEAKKTGALVMGLEPSVKTAEEVQARTGITIIPGFLEQMPESETRFDVITMWDVFEHSSEPQRMLKKAYTMLNDSGVLAITVPNCSSLFSFFAGPFWKGFNQFHVSHFTKQTITNVLKRNGFEILCLETYDNCLFSREGLFRLGIRDRLKAALNSISFLHKMILNKRNKNMQLKQPITGHNDYISGNLKTGFAERVIKRLRLGDQLRILAKKNR